MKKYVFTIKDDVCAANGKDIEATELLAKMKLWGDVEDYEKALAAERTEYDATIKGLNTQLAAIKEQELTEDELVMLRAYRASKAGVCATYQARIDSLEHQLDENRATFQKKAEQISELLAQQ